MGGNVWEWVDDWWQPDYYSVSPGSNPMGPAAGGSKVLRGGGWCYYGGALRVAGREGQSSPMNLSYGVGFRCASTPGG